MHAWTRWEVYSTLLSIPPTLFREGMGWDPGIGIKGGEAEQNGRVAYCPLICSQS